MNAYGNNKTLLEEQSFYFGHYTQTHNYGDENIVDFGGQGTGNIMAFDLNSRSYQLFGSSISDSDILENELYSPDFKDYEFIKYDETRYDDYITHFGNDITIDGEQWGPKESPSNSTCKIRAYYHNISHNNGLVTLMYDFTGFLVGDSLLMTAAHGL